MTVKITNIKDHVQTELSESTEVSHVTCACAVTLSERNNMQTFISMYDM